MRMVIFDYVNAQSTYLKYLVLGKNYCVSLVILMNNISESKYVVC